MTALALPTIARAVPRHYRFENGTEKARRLAQILLDLGLLIAKPPYPSPSELCQDALAAWTAEHTGPLHIYGAAALSVNLSGVEDWIGMQDDAPQDPDVDPERSALFVLTPWDSCGIYTLRARCEAIERRHPGLAQTALHAAHLASWRTLFSWSPASAYEWRDRWPGWGEDEDTEGMLTLEQFQAAVPEWAYRPRQKLSRAKLAALGRDPVAVATLALIDATRRMTLTAHVGHFWHGQFGCVLRWSEHDQVGAMGDDYIDDVRNSGEATTDFSIHVVELTEQAVARWIDGAGRLLHTLGCLDRLLLLLTEEVH